MDNQKPAISVIMPVYNREEYVTDAINSILNQSFSNFEFIIIDDGSTDATFSRLNTLHDSRIKLLKLEYNKGNYFARNKGMEVAQGKYICIMDSDDISFPDRLQKQFDFMESNMNFGLCGGFAKEMSGNKILTPSPNYEELKVLLMSNIIFKHPTLFLRSSLVKDYNLKYNEKFRYAADYDFLVRAANLFPVTNIQEVILEYRQHSDQISVSNKIEQAEISDLVRLKQLSYLNIKANKHQCILHLKLMNRQQIRSLNEFKLLQEWSNYLLLKNNLEKHYHSYIFTLFLKDLLKNILYNFKNNN